MTRGRQEGRGQGCRPREARPPEHPLKLRPAAMASACPPCCAVQQRSLWWGDGPRPCAPGGLDLLSMTVETTGCCQPCPWRLGPGSVTPSASGVGEEQPSLARTLSCVGGAVSAVPASPPPPWAGRLLASGRRDTGTVADGPGGCGPHRFGTRRRPGWAPRTLYCRCPEPAPGGGVPWRVEVGPGAPGGLRLTLSTGFVFLFSDLRICLCPQRRLPARSLI